MRKLHLLLAEWRLAQRLKDERTHKLMCALGWKPGDDTSLADIFPTLAAAEDEESARDDAGYERDDAEIFREPAEALGL